MVGRGRQLEAALDGLDVRSDPRIGRLRHVPCEVEGSARRDKSDRDLCVGEVLGRGATGTPAPLGARRSPVPGATTSTRAAVSPPIVTVPGLENRSSGRFVNRLASPSAIIAADTAWSWQGPIDHQGRVLRSRPRRQRRAGHHPAGRFHGLPGAGDRQRDPALSSGSAGWQPPRVTRPDQTSARSAPGIERAPPPVPPGSRNRKRPAPNRFGVRPKARREVAVQTRRAIESGGEAETDPGDLFAGHPPSARGRLDPGGSRGRRHRRLATMGGSGISPWQGRGRRRRGGHRARASMSPSDFCHRSHESDRASTGRSGTWQPAA